MFVVVFFIVLVVALVSLVITLLPDNVRNNLKRFIALTAIIVTISILFGGVLYGALAEEAPQGYYPRAAVVVSIDYDEDIVTVLDGAELYWEFYGVEDFDIGDVVAMLMWDNNTTSIFDDVIVLAYYSPVKTIGKEVDK